MEWIRVEPTGDMTLRESVLTSIWSCITREFGQPPEERRQMTAVVTLTGALSDRLTARRLQARMVKVVSQPGVRCGTTAFRKERSQGLSGMQGNLHVPFLGGWVGAIPPGYPADEETYRKATRLVPTHPIRLLKSDYPREAQTGRSIGSRRCNGELCPPHHNRNYPGHHVPGAAVYG